MMDWLDLPFKSENEESIRGKKFFENNEILLHYRWMFQDSIPSIYCHSQCALLLSEILIASPIGLRSS